MKWLKKGKCCQPIARLAGCYSFISCISIIETIRVLLLPSSGGISSVAIVILPVFSSFSKRLLVISAASTAVVISFTRAFKVTSLTF
jgi:hypothetical protein